jgi:Flp pilus assembly pilin Flp
VGFAPSGREALRSRLEFVEGAWETLALRPGAAIMMGRFLRRLLVQDCRGATVVELGFLVALIAVAIIGSLQAFSNQLNGTFFTLSNTVQVEP